jgi:hypothetical protein
MKTLQESKGAAGGCNGRALEALPKPRFTQEGPAVFSGILKVSWCILQAFQAGEGTESGDFPRENSIPMR